MREVRSSRPRQAPPESANRQAGLPIGKRAKKGRSVAIVLSPGIEEAVALREKWSEKNHGAAQTWHASTRRSDAIMQLERNGVIDKKQVEWIAQKIANVHRNIEADGAIGVAKPSPIYSPAAFSRR